MNDMENFEETLKKMPPRRPSEALHKRIAQELNTAEKAATKVQKLPPAPWFRQSWFRRAAAALLILLTGTLVYCMLSFREQVPENEQIAVNDTPPSSDSEIPPAGLSYRPVACSRFLVRSEDAGVVANPVSGPARKIRYHTLERIQWRDVVSGRQCTIWQPSEQTVVVAINVD